jgi:hypothetical protein
MSLKKSQCFYSLDLWNLYANIVSTICKASTFKAQQSQPYLVLRENNIQYEENKVIYNEEPNNFVKLINSA